MKAYVATCILGLTLFVLVGCGPDYSDSELVLYVPEDLGRTSQIAEAVYYQNSSGEPCGIHVRVADMPEGTGGDIWTGKVSSYGTPIVIVEMPRRQTYSEISQVESFWYYSDDPEMEPVEEVLLAVLHNTPPSEYDGPVFYSEPDPGQFDDQ